MVRLLSDQNISVIFRMKKDSVKCTELIKSKAQIKELNNGCQLTNCALIIHKHKTEETYLFMSNFKGSIQTIADLYHLRWKVETFFQYLKSQMETKYLKSSDFNNCKQEIYVKIYGYLIARMVEQLALNNISNHGISVNPFRIINVTFF